MKKYNMRTAEYTALLDCLKAVKKDCRGTYVFNLTHTQIKRIVSQVLIGADIKEFHLSVKDQA